MVRIYYNSLLHSLEVYNIILQITVIYSSHFVMIPSLNSIILEYVQMFSTFQQETTSNGVMLQVYNSTVN